MALQIGDSVEFDGVAFEVTSIAENGSGDVRYGLSNGNGFTRHVTAERLAAYQEWRAAQTPVVAEPAPEVPAEHPALTIPDDMGNAPVEQDVIEANAAPEVPRARKGAKGQG